MMTMRRAYRSVIGLLEDVSVLLYLHIVMAVYESRKDMDAIRKKYQK